MSVQLRLKLTKHHITIGNLRSCQVMKLFGAFDFGEKVSSSKLHLLIFANQNRAYTYKVYQKGTFFTLF